jgi:hypothetical protein
MCSNFISSMFRVTRLTSFLIFLYLLYTSGYFVLIYFFQVLFFSFMVCLTFISKGLFHLLLLGENFLTRGTYINISAIHKKGNRKIVSNYRPVSLTSVVCKVIESIVRDHIMDYFIKNKLFSNCQHGFIKNRSTVTQLLKVLDKWTELLELGGQIDVIYTDLEKAFDKVPHKFL